MSPKYLQALLGPDGCLTSALAEGVEVALRVSGGCMEPDLADGAVIRMEGSRLFVPGDVVAFHCPHQNRLLMHRFLGYVRTRGRWKLMTMADRGTRPDPLVDLASVLGRVAVQSGRAYHVGPGKRLQAVRRYSRWGARYVIRRILR
ncbi:S24/S26 family peptidase [Thiocapsa sp.]|uniref:S24/S26 family peptidase n=1 Tax=Thiocapsa sp. TaxID=2024551 RepID=UPI002CEC1CBE|nr:S24/S26 family peptidase [Thiocapsa sp.]HSO81139.1 S24/S26 family peptidase [Thiocapsa sp.]